MQTPPAPSHRDDRGFTLVELLIVIVILGILATVAVFAVRGITDKGQENAEGSDLGTIETAIDAYWMNEGSNPTEQELVTAGYLQEESGLHDIVVAPDGSYTITNVRTGATVGSGQAGGSAAPSSGVNGWLGSASTVAGIQAVSYGNPSGSTRVLFIGGPNAKAVWNAGVTANNGLSNASYYFTMVDIGQLTNAATIDALIAIRNNYAGFGMISDDNVNIVLPGASNVQQYINMHGGGFGMSSQDLATFFNPA